MVGCFSSAVAGIKVCCDMDQGTCRPHVLLHPLPKVDVWDKPSFEENKARVAWILAFLFTLPTG